MSTPKIIPRLFAGLCLLLAGCSELIPGLNIRVGSQDRHEYRIQANDADNGYKVSPATSALSYRVVPITPDLMVSLSTEPMADPLIGPSLKSLLPSDVPSEYRLGPGDVYFVVVWDHPELTAPYTGLTQDLSNQGRLIASDGTSFYPYVGTFNAAGMTAGELRQYLIEHLNKVVRNPQVDVRVVAYRANRIEVTGEVQKPGTITLDDTPKGIIQAIDACGGLTINASRRRAILVRHGEMHEIDLAGLISGAKPAANPGLEPGDVVHLPDQSGDQVFMLGAVNKQAPVTIQQDSMTLIQALTVAGGLDNTRGKDSGVIIFRPHRMNTEADTTAEVFTLALGRPEGILLASEFKLLPHDVVFVQATAFAQYNSVVNELLPTVTSLFYLQQLQKNGL